METNAFWEKKIYNLEKSYLIQRHTKGQACLRCYGSQQPSGWDSICKDWAAVTTRV